MKKVGVIHHSGYGHTSNQARGTVSGIDRDDDISEADWQAVDASGAIIFGSPTYMGIASWQFKKFADATSRRWVNLDWNDRLATGSTKSASMNVDKHSTLHSSMTLAMRHSILWVGNGLMPSKTRAEVRDDINCRGSFGGLMAQSPFDASTDAAPTTGDIETARAFGVRFATVVRDSLR